MRALKKVEEKWVVQHPSDLLSWIWLHEGYSAVVVDDEKEIYYCATDNLMSTYTQRWRQERKKGDKRQVSTFKDLERLLFAKETPLIPDQSAAWCKQEGKLCSEVAVCGEATKEACR